MTASCTDITGIALIALAALELSGDAVHEPVHTRSTPQGSTLAWSAALRDCPNHSTLALPAVYKKCAHRPHTR
jgi:hypothetical protein